jgi:hypothetical protein
LSLSITGTILQKALILNGFGEGNIFTYLTIVLSGFLFCALFSKFIQKKFNWHLKI